MKSIEDFATEEAYWKYVHTQATISVMCVLVSKPHWESTQHVAKSASNLADKVVAVLRKKK